MKQFLKQTINGEILDIKEAVENRLRISKAKSNNIETTDQINKSLSFLKHKVIYKFDQLYIVKNRKIITAKYRPSFIKKWMYNIDTYELPSSIKNGIKNCKLIRSYNHELFSNKEDKRHKLGTGLLMISSEYINAINKKEKHVFIISFYFELKENIDLNYEV